MADFVMSAVSPKSLILRLSAFVLTSLPLLLLAYQRFSYADVDDPSPSSCIQTPYRTLYRDVLESYQKPSALPK